MGMNRLNKRKKAHVRMSECVACGVCMAACPIQAICVTNGMYAEVAKSKCVGCAKCASACPASVISMEEAAV